MAIEMECEMILRELELRGLVYQKTSERLGEILKSPTSFYCGMDPTSKSLHLGSLLPLLVAKRLQSFGHRPILLLGGATGRIGDPSGKSKERQLLSPEQIEENIAGIKKITEKFVDFTGNSAAKIVNNWDWMRPFSYIDFLRDVGKHFSVNAMVAKDSVKERLTQREQGISYTEFSYMLLQAYDFYHLWKSENCVLQIGGSDQWGNMTAGVDLIRRMQGEVDTKDEVYAMTFPLVTKSDGSKFGKSESGNIWLDPERTSPYHFYQYLVRLSDQEIPLLLKYFSMKPWDEVSQLLDRCQQSPEKREAQQSLARELTQLVHGDEECRRVEHASQVLFSGKLQELDRKTILEVFAEVPSKKWGRQAVDQKSLVEFLVEGGLCSSKGAARKDLKAGAIYLNNERFTGDGDSPLGKSSLLFESLVVARRGKKNYCLMQFD